MDTSVPLITHDLALAAERANTVAVMRRGRVVESGTPRQIFDAPRSGYTRELLDAIPGAGLTAA